MGTSANRKMTTLPKGMKFTPVYTKCPKCGCDLNQIPEAFINQIKANEAKDSSGKAKASPKACTKETLAPNLLNLCIAWMILPFTTTKKYSAKRSQKRFVGWKLRK